MRRAGKNRVIWLKKKKKKVEERLRFLRTIAFNCKFAFSFLNKSHLRHYFRSHEEVFHNQDM